MKALEIFKRSFGEDHVQCATTLDNLSNVLFELGDYMAAK
jgi:hypothetical protein